MVVGAIIVFILVTAMALIWVNILEKPIHKEYEQCIGCNNGFCTLEPGSEECIKEKALAETWRKEDGT